jgi:hypothetical protein
LLSSKQKPNEGCKNDASGKNHQQQGGSALENVVDYRNEHSTNGGSRQKRSRIHRHGYGMTTVFMNPLRLS